MIHLLKKPKLLLAIGVVALSMIYAAITSDVITAGSVSACVLSD